MIHTCARCGKEFTGRKKKYCSEDCSKEAIRIRNRERWRKTNPQKQSVTIKCEWCGNKHTVPPRTAHQARFCSDNCKHNWRNRIVNGCKPVKDYNKERKQQKMIRLNKLEKLKALKDIKTSIQKVIKYKEEEQRVRELTRECAECGNLFYNPSPNTLTCSSECSRKRNRRISREIYKGRINKSNLVDKDISLTKLYNRDRGMCYLCSEQCDWNDKVVTNEGHTIVGGKYPSIEHVVPLSKNGKHSWVNVKLSCMRCNTLKRDNI